MEILHTPSGRVNDTDTCTQQEPVSTHPLGRERLLAFALVLPTILIVVGVSLGPLLFAGWLSLHDVDINFPARNPSSACAITSKSSRTGVSRGDLPHLYFAAASLSLQIPLGWVAPSCSNQKFAGRKRGACPHTDPVGHSHRGQRCPVGVDLQLIFGALNGVLIQFGLMDKP